MEIISPYGLLDRVKNEIERCGGALEQAEYGADVKITAVFDSEQAPVFAQRLSYRSRCRQEPRHGRNTPRSKQGRQRASES
jgi:putative IMPACT (imprinted ancient) family translation regulator